jgi:DNA adenine methylase
MKYMGSKARHAKDILPIILEGRSAGQVYVEPFVGGANTIDKVPGTRIASDFNQYVAALWDATANGWLPPKFVSEDDYEAAKTSEDMAYKGYVGFALSFGGKFFGGYRRDVAGTKGCVENMKTQSRRAYESFEKQAKNMIGVSVHHADYKKLPIPPKSIIYCDPPYAGTTKYATGSFNHKDLWDWCIEMDSMHHKVFVSEYSAPDGWECVWEKSVNNTLVKDSGSKQGVERLFRRKA